jgi:hypothetical protein
MVRSAPFIMQNLASFRAKDGKSQPASLLHFALASALSGKLIALWKKYPRVLFNTLPFFYSG